MDAHLHIRNFKLMSDMVVNPKDWFSRVAAHMLCKFFISFLQIIMVIKMNLVIMLSLGSTESNSSKLTCYNEVADNRLSKIIILGAIT